MAATCLPIRHAVFVAMSAAAASLGLALAPEALSADPPSSATRVLRVVVLDPSGKPMPGAKVRGSIWTKEKDFKPTREYQTDPTGSVSVELPKTFYIVRLWASQKPFVTMFAGWERNELASGNALPAEYIFRLEPGVTAGGRVVDEKGKAVAGAKVEVRL